MGTPPAVVTGAPPVVSEGMRVNVSNTNITNTTVNNTVINNTVINNRVVNNVTIVAPASATANHQEVNSTVPAQAHLAAAQAPVVRVPAPAPASSKPVAPYVPGHEVSLPPPQEVRAVVPPELTRLQAAPTREAGRPPSEPARQAAAGREQEAIEAKRNAATAETEMNKNAQSEAVTAKRAARPMPRKKPSARLAESSAARTREEARGQGSRRQGGRGKEESGRGRVCQEEGGRAAEGKKAPCACAVKANATRASVARTGWAGTRSAAARGCPGGCRPRTSRSYPRPTPVR